MTGIINADRDRIYKAIKEKRIYDAFKEIDILFNLECSPNLASRLEAAKNAYSDIAQSVLLGDNNPERDKKYEDLVKELYELTDIIIDDIKIYNSFDYVYTKRTHYRNNPEDIKKHIALLTKEQDKFKSLKASKADNSELIASMKAIEAIQETIFDLVVSTFSFSEEEYKTTKLLLDYKKFGEVTSSLVVSALTISAIYFYSEKKILTLYDTYFSTDCEEVKQRALCGAIILSYIHRDRVNSSYDINRRVELFSDDKDFCNDIREHLYQFIRTLKIEKTADFINTEIIDRAIEYFPEHIKDITDSYNNAEKDETKKELRKISVEELKESGIIGKFFEMKGLQTTGYDTLYNVYYNLKYFPFFSKLYNWLRPYTDETSSIYSLIKRDYRFSEILNNADIMCSSDRYSLASLFIEELEKTPVKKFDDEPLDEDFFYYMFNGSPELVKRTPRNIIILYIQDLYRVFNASNFKLPNIFEYNIDLMEVKPLRPIINNEETLRKIANLYYEGEHYLFAQKYFNELIKFNVTDSTNYENLGLCKEKLKDYEGAIAEYIKADQISEDFWTFNRLAICYREIGNIKKAIEFFRDALRVKPSSLTTEFNLAKCLMLQDKYEDALKILQKIDFFNEGSIKIWRQMAHCLLALGRFDDAENLYMKALSNNPKPVDYLNAGNFYLVTKKQAEACNYYSKCLQEAKGNKKLFGKAFSGNYEFLLKVGASDNDIAIIRDLYVWEK